MGRKPIGLRAMSAAERMRKTRAARRWTRTVNVNGHDTLRPSDDVLHRAANKHLLEVGDALFGNLPGIIGQIIEHRVWASMGFKSFADYAVCSTGDGLNITDDRRLLLLKIALGVDSGEHAEEWAEVQSKLAQMSLLRTPGVQHLLG